jgi:hypothetical protein
MNSEKSLLDKTMKNDGLLPAFTNCLDTLAAHLYGYVIALKTASAAPDQAPGRRTD